MTAPEIAPGNARSSDAAEQSRDGESGASAERVSGLLGGSVYGILSTGSQRALDFAMRLLAARLLGAAQFGTLSIGLSLFFPVATLSLFGLRVGMVRSVARAAVEDEPGGFSRCLCAGLAIVLPVGLLASLAGFALAPSLSSVFFEEPVLLDVARALAVALVPYLLSQLLVAGLVGRRDMRRVFFVLLVERGAILVSFLLLVGWGFELPAAALCYPLGILLGLGAALALTGPLKNRSLPSAAETLRQARRMLGFTFPVWLSDSLLTVRRYVDLLILASLLSAAETGVYAAATLLAGAVLIPLFGTERIFLTTASRLVAQGKHADLDRVYKTCARWLFWWGGMAFALAASVPGELMRSGFGNDYVGGQTALTILFAGAWLNTTTATQGSLNYALGNTGIILFGSMLGLVVVVAVAVLLAPRLGLVGAAVAAASSLALSEGVMLLHLYRKHRIQPFQRTHLAVLLGVGLSWALAAALHNWVASASAWTALALAAMVVSTVFAGLALASPSYSSDLMAALGKFRNLARQVSQV